MRIVDLSQLEDFELVPGAIDPSQFMVVGAADFVLGSVQHLLVDPERREVRYLVVNTRLSNYRENRGEERLVPIEWVEIVPSRRQVRLPQLSRYGFRRLPLYQAEGEVPDEVEFPHPLFEDPDLRDIA